MTDDTVMNDRLKKIQLARSQFTELSRGAESIQALSQWVGWFYDKFFEIQNIPLEASLPKNRILRFLKNKIFFSRTQDISEDKNGESLNFEDIGIQFFNALDVGQESNPIFWCNARNLQLDIALVSVFNERIVSGGNSISIPPFVAYCLGRAAMKNSLLFPAITKGLSLPYLLVEKLDLVGAAMAGVDDELSESNILNFKNAVCEVRKRILELSIDPISGIYEYARDRQKGIVEVWRNSVSIGQAVSHHFETLVIDWPLGHVICSIAVSSPELAAELFDGLGHPSLQISIFMFVDKKNLEIFEKILPYCSLVFEDDGSWNHRSGARILIDLFEKRLFEIYSIQRKNEDQLEVDKKTIPKVISFGKTILCRTDGPRLMVEWISSLINKIIIRYEFTSSSKDYWIGYYDMIVSNLIELLKEKSWAQSQGIWKLFCGKEEIVRDVDIKYLSEGRLPYWIDSTGRKDSVMPLAISALMKKGVGIQVEELVEVMVPWYQAVFLRLKEEPQLSRLGQSGNSVLIDILAWPIAYSKNPTLIIQSLWNKASHVRLRARFARSADDHDYATACNAIARLGISAHIFISKREDGKLFSKSLGDILCEYVDEIRYCVPMIGLPNGYDPIFILTASISINGLLTDIEACRIFFGHFIGDDEALAKVIVSASMNGVSKDILRAGLLENGIVFKNLYDSWMMWNNNKIGARVSESSDYIKHLSDILI